MFDWISDAAKLAFSWLGDNPEFTGQLLVGAGSAALDYMSQQKQLEDSFALQERRKPQYATVENYTGQLTGEGGLLTNGLLAKNTG